MISDEHGSSPVEFVLVGSLLTALTLAVLQLGLAVHVRNMVHDAAVEGAYHAALADTALADGAQRTREVIGRTIGEEYAEDVTVHEARVAGAEVAVVEVRTTLPLTGLLGIPYGLEVSADAPMESLAE